MGSTANTLDAALYPPQGGFFCLHDSPMFCICSRMALLVSDVVRSYGRITAWCASCKKLYVLAGDGKIRAITLDAAILDVQDSLRCRRCNRKGELWVSFPTEELRKMKTIDFYAFNNTPFKDADPQG